MLEELYAINGIHGNDGTYWLNPMSRHHIATIAEHALPPHDDVLRQDDLRELQTYHILPVSVAHLNELKAYTQRANAQTSPYTFDPRNLAEAGWGILFAKRDERAYAIHEALSELLQHRAMQAGNRYKVFIGADAYCAETRTTFLRGRPAIVDPGRVPYYLLIVGEPDVIPWEFHYHLACYHAVGRIAFETLDEYAQYAHSVVEAEKDTFSLPRTATFFGVRNTDDLATQILADTLIQPLATMLAEEQPDWHIQTMVGEQATRQHVCECIGCDATPALLVAAGQGVVYPRGTLKRMYHQGAIICQDWPGPVQWGQWGQQPIPEDYYVAGIHIDAHACFTGTIAFLCASGSAGTSHTHTSDSLQQTEKTMPRAFIADLPRRMLGHRKGGALAVVGHRAYVWSYAPQEPHEQSQHAPGISETQAFHNALNQLMGGDRLGLALEPLRVGYREALIALSTLFPLDVQAGTDRVKKERQVAVWWAMSRNLRDYVIIGDPAVRLHVSDKSPSDERVYPTPATVNLPSINALRPSNPSVVESSAEEAPWTPRTLEYGLQALMSSLVNNNLDYRRLQALAQHVETLEKTEQDLCDEKRTLAKLQDDYKQACEEEQHYVQQAPGNQDADVGTTTSITIENPKFASPDGHTLTIEDFIQGHHVTFSADAALVVYEVLRQQFG